MVINGDPNASAGNRVTIATGAKAPSPTGHDGFVTIDGNQVTDFVIWGEYGNYITIDGEKSGARNLRITNSQIRATSLGAGIYFNTRTGIRVYYVEIDNVSNGITVTYCNPLCAQDDAERCDFANNYLHDIRVNHGIRVDGSCMSGSTYNCAYDGIKIRSNEIQVNTLNLEDGSGADGIEGTCGLTIYNNTLYGSVGVLYPKVEPSSYQHQDLIQSGYYLKAYNNIFYDWADSAIDRVISGNNGYTRVWNNLFIKKNPLRVGNTAGYRSYSEGAEVTSLTDILIYNNTFVDINSNSTQSHAIQFTAFGGGNPTLSGVAIKNNIILNCGISGSAAAIYIAASTGANQADWNVDFNVVNAGAHGSDVLTVDGSNFSQSNGQSGLPSFASYSEKSATNNFRLNLNDTVAMNNGTDLGSSYNTDILGVSRPQGPSWDIGAYEFVYGQFYNLSISGGVLR
jgi:hypothetical protein